MREFPWLVAGGSAGKNLPIRGADEPSFTIKAGNETHRVLYEDGTVARLNGRHLARLMGVEDGFRLPKSNTLARIVLGNGLPPRLLDTLVRPMLSGVRCTVGCTVSADYRIPFLDLFCGAGVGTYGLRDVARKVAGIEVDARIAPVHRLNYPEAETILAPVQDVDYSFKGVEWLHASPVCKRFSVAKSGGTRLKDGTRIRHEAGGEQELDIVTAGATVDAIRALMPRWVTIENVPAYKDSDALGLIMEELNPHYYVNLGVYEAAEYGTPQNRKRLIVRADLERPVPLVEPTTPEPASWWDAVEDLADSMTTTKLAAWQWPRILPEGTPWMRCPSCEDYLCTACPGELHVADCACPSLEVWSAAGRYPYKEGE